MLFPGKAAANKGTAAVIAGVICAALIACTTTPDFYVNPTSPPTSAVSPTPSPKAQVFRVIPVENPPTPTPTQQPGVTLEHPEWLISRMMDKMRFRDYVKVQGQFFKSVYPDYESAGQTDDDQGPIEVAVRIEGEYSAISGSSGTPYPYADFHIWFHHEATAATGEAGVNTWDTEVEVRQYRFVTDTTANMFPTYRTHAAWRDDAWDRDLNKLPNMAMFLSLALTEDQLVEYRMLEWMRFEPEQVRVVTALGDEGSKFWVLAATRSMPNGDLEEWTFWIDEREFPWEIALTIRNEDDPTRGVEGARLEFVEIGDCLSGWPCHN